MPVELRGRVVVRDFCEADRDAFVAGFADDAIWQLTSLRLDSTTVVRAFERVVRTPDEPRRWWDLAIEAPDGELAGWAALFGRTDAGEVELGWYLLPSHWRRGYATAATELLLSFASSALACARVIAHVDPENVGSLRVLERCGFVDEGPVEPADTWRGPRARRRLAVRV